MIAALIAIIALLMLGGTAGTGWTADLERAIKHEVTDKNRQEAVLDVIDDHEDEMEAIGESVQDHFVQLLETHLDFQSSEKSFDLVEEKLKQDQAAAFTRDLKTRETMKSNLTPEEWNTVFSQEK